MRIAFLILSHRAPEQLLRLLTTLRRQLPDSPLVVHHDKFRADLDAAALDLLGDVHVLTSDQPVTWGDFSLVDVCWRSMAWMALHIEFDWVIVLSAQDYPIKPLVGLADAIAQTGADALMSAAPINDLPNAVDRRNRRRRYLYQYCDARARWPVASVRGRLWANLRQCFALPADVFNNVQPYFQLYKLPDRMPWRLGRVSRSTPFTSDAPCWFGSVWYGLSRKAVDYLITFTQGNPQFAEYYRHTVCPDESATATVICNAPDLRVEQCALHYVRWTRPRSGHPDMLGIEDLADLLSAPGYFARKFDMTVDSAVLDKLDEVPLGANPTYCRATE